MRIHTSYMSLAFCESYDVVTPIPSGSGAPAARAAPRSRWAGSAAGAARRAPRAAGRPPKSIDRL